VDQRRSAEKAGAAGRGGVRGPGRLRQHRGRSGQATPHRCPGGPGPALLPAPAPRARAPGPGRRAGLPRTQQSSVASASPPRAAAMPVQPETPGVMPRPHPPTGLGPPPAPGRQAAQGTTPGRPRLDLRPSPTDPHRVEVTGARGADNRLKRPRPGRGDPGPPRFPRAAGRSASAAPNTNGKPRNAGPGSVRPEPVQPEPIRPGDGTGLQTAPSANLPSQFAPARPPRPPGHLPCRPRPRPICRRPPPSAPASPAGGSARRGLNISRSRTRRTSHAEVPPRPWPRSGQGRTSRWTCQAPEGAVTVVNAPGPARPHDAPRRRPVAGEDDVGEVSLLGKRRQRKTGWTPRAGPPLDWAASGGHASVVQTSPGRRRGTTNLPRPDRRPPPLHWAAIFDQKETAELLIDRGARHKGRRDNPGQRRRCTRPVEHDAVEAAGLLISKGASPEGERRGRLHGRSTAVVRHAGRAANLAGPVADRTPTPAGSRGQPPPPNLRRRVQGDEGFHPQTERPDDWSAAWADGAEVKRANGPTAQTPLHLAAWGRHPRPGRAADCQGRRPTPPPHDTQGPGTARWKMARQRGAKSRRAKLLEGKGGVSAEETRML